MPSVRFRERWGEGFDLSADGAARICETAALCFDPGSAPEARAVWALCWIGDDERAADEETGLIGRDDPGDSRGPERARNDEHAENREFALERKHERRILSWSPDPVEEIPDEVDAEVQAPAASDDSSRLPRAVPEPTAEPAATPKPHDPAEPSATPGTPTATTGTEPRRRGRPRGRPRRQVHFHVDPDEELLLLEAAKKQGSQQKGLIAALQALQDNEVLRAEIDRLRAECERQRILLANAEAIFKR